MKQLLIKLVNLVLWPVTMVRRRIQLRKWKKFDAMYQNLSRQQRRKLLRTHGVTISKKKRRRK